MKLYQFEKALQIVWLLFFLAEAVPVRSKSFSYSSPAATSHHHHHHRSPERGKILPCTILDPADLYAAYQEIRNDYQTKAFSRQGVKTDSSDNCWKVLHQHGDVQVALWHHPADATCPYVRMTGRFPVSPQECWDFLKVDRWNDTMPKMDPFFEGVTVHGEFWCNNSTMTATTSDDDDDTARNSQRTRNATLHMILCRKRTKRILAFGKRDLVFLSVQGEPLEDGTLVSASVSVITPLLPRMPGYTRAFQDSVAFYKPVDNGEATDLTIVCRIDLNDSAEDGRGGHIPMWLYVKTIGRTGVQSVLRMRHALVEEKHRRQQNQQQMLRGNEQHNHPSLSSE